MENPENAITYQRILLIVVRINTARRTALWHTEHPHNPGTLLSTDVSVIYLKPHFGCHILDDWLSGYCTSHRYYLVPMFYRYTQIPIFGRLETGFKNLNSWKLCKHISLCISVNAPVPRYRHHLPENTGTFARVYRNQKYTVPVSSVPALHRSCPAYRHFTEVVQCTGTSQKLLIVPDRHFPEIVQSAGTSQKCHPDFREKLIFSSQILIAFNRFWNLLKLLVKQPFLLW